MAGTRCRVRRQKGLKNPALISRIRNDTAELKGGGFAFGCARRGTGKAGLSSFNPTVLGRTGYTTCNGQSASKRSLFIDGVGILQHGGGYFSLGERQRTPTEL
jgi:hypothetical protein